MSSEIVTGLPWTDMAQIYKEYIAAKNCIEYTIFWREPEGKMRMNFEVEESYLEEEEENSPTNKAYELYKSGSYINVKTGLPPEPVIAVKEDTAPVENGSLDPFLPENAPGLNLVVSMRIYDVLLGIYSHLNPEKAAELIRWHAAGNIAASLPVLDLTTYDEDTTTTNDA